MASIWLCVCVCAHALGFFSAAAEVPVLLVCGTVKSVVDIRLLKTRLLYCHKLRHKSPSDKVK